MVGREDVLSVAKYLKIELTPFELDTVIERLAETDDYDIWNVIIEDIIYNIKNS